VPVLALVVGELLEEEGRVARLLGPQIAEVLHHRVGADIGERRRVARALVDGAEHAHLDERLERGLAVGLGLEGEHHLVEGLILVLLAQVHVADGDVVVGVALERLADGLEVLERPLEVALVGQRRGEVELGGVIVAVHDGDALERLDRALVVVLAEGLLRLLPERRVVDEALEAGDQCGVAPAPGAVLPGGRGGEELLHPFARLVDVEALVREPLELGLGDGHLRG